MISPLRNSFVPSLFLVLLAGCAGSGTPGHDGSADGGVVAPARCVVGGCSGQLCVSADIEPPITTCEFLPEYACYDTADCGVQADGHCGWTLTPELMQCLADARDPGPTEPDPEEPPADPKGECVPSGCSGQLCIPADADPIATTCEWRPEYACYQDADCEKQPDGSCGWTPTAELAECLDNAGATDQ